LGAHTAQVLLLLLVAAHLDGHWRVRRQVGARAAGRRRRLAAGSVLLPELGAPILEPNLHSRLRELDARGQLLSGLCNGDCCVWRLVLLERKGGTRRLNVTLAYCFVS